MSSPDRDQKADSMKARDVLRWIAVLPAALIAAFAGGRLIAGACYAILAPRRAGDPPVSGSLATILELVSHVPAGVLFVVAGSMVAPRRRLRVSLVLAVCWLGLSLFTHLFTQSRWGETNVRHVVMESLGAAIGIACVRYLDSRPRTAE